LGSIARQTIGGCTLKLRYEMAHTVLIVFMEGPANLAPDLALRIKG
jgi:hypothetical protein